MYDLNFNISYTDIINFSAGFHVINSGLGYGTLVYSAPYTLYDSHVYFRLRRIDTNAVVGDSEQFSIKWFSYGI